MTDFEICITNAEAFAKSFDVAPDRIEFGERMGSGGKWIYCNAKIGASQFEQQFQSNGITIEMFRAAVHHAFRKK